MLYLYVIMVVCYMLHLVALSSRHLDFEDSRLHLVLTTLACTRFDIVLAISLFHCQENVRKMH